MRPKKPMPVVEDGVPYCTDKCPMHDGKRCEATGFRPDTVCIPDVQRMSQLLESYQRASQ